MVETSRCTGCAACAAVCPVDAITMKEDAEGFLYPHIDPERCVNCGKCHKVCPVDQKIQPEMPQQAFLAMADDETLILKSSSGGVFSLLARQILADGGMVFGCAMTEDCYGAHHIGIDSDGELWRLQGSKYVQSAMENTLRQAKTALSQGKRVLFSGTPCQIAGVKSYLGDSEKLLTVDVICHGAPSPMAWKAYLTAREKDAGAKAVRVSFRNKAEGWQHYSLECVFDNGEIYRKKVTEDLYLRGFVENLFLRPSCYGCVVKADQYRSDITCGDWWGLARFYPELRHAMGVSLMIPHTEKGKAAIGALRSCRVEEVDLDKALKNNPSFFTPAVPNPYRNRAIRQVRSRGTDGTLKKYCGNAFGAKVRKKLAKLLRRP